VALDPEVVVICVGAANTFGHPSLQVVERLIDRLGEDNVYRTDQDGTIEFITDGERLWVSGNELLYENPLSHLPPSRYFLLIAYHSPIGRHLAWGAQLSESLSTASKYLQTSVSHVWTKQDCPANLSAPGHQQMVQQSEDESC
jgi:hypothetical protein